MRLLRRAVVLIAAVFVAIQLVPYGWRHSNPAVARETPWPNAQARAIAADACYDCHSNETDWPWYSFVAPMSWLVRNDVEQGRDELNFSRYGEDRNAMRDAAETVRDGEMPPRNYMLLHAEARLSDEEKRTLIEALEVLSAELRGGGPG